jgi:hypothetical protein
MGTSAKSWLVSVVVAAILGCSGGSTNDSASRAEPQALALPAATPAFVQVGSAVSSSASSLAIPYPDAQAEGDLNVVTVMWGDTTSTVASVTDSRGNVYALAAGPTKGAALTSSTYYAKNIAVGSNTVTVKFNQTAAFPNANVLEYSGVDTTSPLDVNASATGDGTTANSGSATTTSANELIIGAGNAQNSFTAPGSGFNKRIINAYGGIAEDQIASTPGSHDAVATLQSGNWVMQMVAFKAAVGSSGPCSDTSYGDGVTCIKGAGQQTRTDQTTVSVPFAPAAGHAVIATGYSCWDSDCKTTGTTTLSIGDNVHGTEACFLTSPHSPFTLIETSASKEHIQEYVWVCPNIPSGVNTLTMTCSSASACNWMTLLVTEWTGLATSDPFDVDGSATSSVQGTTATVSASTTKTHDLILTYGDTTYDQWSCPVAPYQAPEECCNATGGNINAARTTGSTKGAQTAQITWASGVSCLGHDTGGVTTDWFQVIVGVKSLLSQ